KETASTAAALETARHDAEIAARKNAEAFEARLNELESTVRLRAAHELETMQNAHRSSLIAIAIVAGVALLGMLLVAALMMRSMNRREKAITALQPFGPGFATTALMPAGASLMALNPAEQTSARFISAIEQLEKRLHELEHTTAPHPANG